MSFRKKFVVIEGLRWRVKKCNLALMLSCASDINRPSYQECSRCWKKWKSSRSFLLCSRMFQLGTDRPSLICWRPISPLWFLCNSALGCKWGKLAPFIYLSIYLSITDLISQKQKHLLVKMIPKGIATSHRNQIFDKLDYYKKLWCVKPHLYPVINLKITGG